MDEDELLELAGGTQETDVSELRRAWINEKASPEILQFKLELVQRLTEQAQHQEKLLLMQVRDTEDITTANLYWMDLNRVKFLLRAYLRVRLAKIEEHVLHTIKEEQLFARLSPQEQEFAKGYTDAVERHFRASVLDAMPPQYDSLLQQIEDGDASTSYDMIPEPNLDGHVFCRVKEDKGHIEIDEDQNVDLVADDLLIIRYRPIRALVEEESVQLVCGQLGDGTGLRPRLALTPPSEAGRQPVADAWETASR